MQNLRQHATEPRRVLEEVNSEWCYEAEEKIEDLRQRALDALSEFSL